MNNYQVLFRNMKHENCLLDIHANGHRYYGVLVCDPQLNYVVVQLPGLKHCKIKYETITNVARIHTVKQATDKELNDELTRRERKKNPVLYALMASMRNSDIEWINIHMKDGKSYYECLVQKIEHDIHRNSGIVSVRTRTDDYLDLEINEISNVCRDALLPKIREYVESLNPTLRREIVNIILENRTEAPYFDD